MGEYMKKIIFTLATITCALGAFSQNVGGTNTDNGNHLQLNTITTAVPFLIITPDSRSGALGDVGAAISPDANSFHWNTSKLVFSK